jgi:hypothetical protein
MERKTGTSTFVVGNDDNQGWNIQTMEGFLEPPAFGPEE